MNLRSFTFLLAAMVIMICGSAISQTITGSRTVCQAQTPFTAGTSTTLTGSPAGGSWSSYDTTVVKVNGSGVVTGYDAGITNITYTVGATHTYESVTCNPLPAVIVITAPGLACAGFTVPILDATPGGTWSASNPVLATIGVTSGILSGISSGWVVTTYTLPTTCLLIAPVQVLGPGPVNGPSSVCMGSTITMTVDTPGGVWSSSNSTIAQVAGTGVVTGIAGGTAIISYSISGLTDCPLTTTTKTITVNITPTGGTISGPTTVCQGAAVTLTGVIGGGVWSSSNTAIATATGAGVITGAAPGVATISYIASNACGTATATRGITVNPLPAAGTITGLSTGCAGATIALADAAPGGLWSSGSTSIALAGGTGIITGVAGGSATISYSVTNTCGTAVATHLVSISPMPVVSAISGASSVCAGSTMTLTDATAGGAWSSSSAGLASVSAGVVTGLAPGAATISYSVTNSCGTTVATKPITINVLPVAGTITGATGLCAGTTATLTDASAGGVWSSSSTGIAMAGGAGTITGVAAGAATIYYTVTNACGTATATHSITVNPAASAGTITGLSGVCVGAAIILTDAMAGGVWSSSSTAASVSGGLVAGLVPGSTTISYAVTNTCGTATATRTVTVSIPPDAGTIIGASSVCAGSVITLTDAAAGGVWSSSSTAIALASGTGIITGVAEGSVTIIYSVTNACATATATQLITVNPAAIVSVIAGASGVCEGATITLTDTMAGGVWSSSSAIIATTVGTGISVTGLAAGTATISYSVSSVCGTATTHKTITVSKFPVVGAITGATSVCTGATIILYDPSFGGVWGSNTGNASVSGGAVRGLSPGTAVISYSLTNICGTAITTRAVTVVNCPEGATTLTNNTAELNVSPNPNKGTFTLTLSSPADEPVLVTVTNIAGEKVKVLSTTTNVATNINLNVASGIYLINAVTGDGRYMAKVMVSE